MLADSSNKFQEFPEKLQILDLDPIVVNMFTLDSWEGGEHQQLKRVLTRLSPGITGCQKLLWAPLTILSLRWVTSDVALLQQPDILGTLSQHDLLVAPSYVFPI